MRRPVGISAVLVAVLATTGACGDNNTASPASVVVTTRDDGAAPNLPAGGFCEAMAHLIVLLAPTDNSSPAETESTFTEAAGWFEQANDSAPDEIAADFVAYKTAYDKYAVFLGTVGFNLNSVFATPEGKQLAIDTSHTLTPAIVEHTIGSCGLSFGDEEHDPPG